MKKTMTFLITVVFVSGILSAGFAANFPTRSIRSIVPFSPGGGTDMMARFLAKSLEKQLGAKIFVEAIPGGGTKLATVELMKAKPNGYTIINPSELSWVGGYYAKVFDEKVWEKLTPIATVATDPIGIWLVRDESPFRTFAELIKAAKEKPGNVTIGLSSRGVYDILVLSLGKAAGVVFKPVPFTGSAPADVALLGGHVDIRFSTPADSITMIRSGKMKPLAIQDEKRHPLLPDVPTVKELGYDVMTLEATRTVWGPPKMSGNIVDIYTKAIEKVTRDPEFVKAAEEICGVKVEFRSGRKMIEEGVINLDKKAAKPLIEFNSK
jgi:putative tricarboxylic transport membrane protein